MNASAASVQTFFNQLSAEYDELIDRSIPRYREMFWAMLYYLPQDFVPRRILELGCGTGNLTQILARRWPQAELTVVDISEAMLAQTKEKLAPHPITCVASGFETLSFDTGRSFDLVISSIAIHHIEDAAKARLATQIAQWLAPGGFFVMGDQVKGVTERLYQADIAYYEAFAMEQGATGADIAQWAEHRETQDHYATLDNWRLWLSQAGFVNVDVLWRYCFWAVIQAQKPAA